VQRLGMMPKKNRAWHGATRAARTATRNEAQQLSRFGEKRYVAKKRCQKTGFVARVPGLNPSASRQWQ
jgi:hypothetical protein